MPARFHPNEQAAATHTRLVVSTWLAVMAAQAYLCRLSISVAAKHIRADLNLTEFEMGVIMGPAFFWAYALAQIPSSRLGERWGARISLPLFVLTWSLATAAFGVVHWFPILVSIWIVAGLSQAGAFPVATRTIATWYPPSERALATGSLVALMSLGAAVGAGVTGSLIQGISFSNDRLLRIPWQQLFGIYAIPGLVWAIVFYFWFRNRPEDHPAVNAAELSHIREGAVESAAPGHHEPTPWSVLLTSWPLWLICGQQFCRASAMIFIGSWFPTFLQESRQITLARSGLLTILPHLAVAMAGLIGGGVADAIFRRTGRLEWSRKGLAVNSLMMSTALIFTSYFVSDATLAVIVFSAGIFFAGLAGPVAYTVTIDLGGRHVGAVFATMNMVGNVGAGLFPLFVTWFRKGLETNPSLLKIFSGDSWNAVVVLVALLHLGAAACWWALPMRRTICDSSDLTPES